MIRNYFFVSIDKTMMSFPLKCHQRGSVVKNGEDYISTDKNLETGNWDMDVINFFKNFRKNKNQSENEYVEKVVAESFCQIYKDR